MGSHIWVGEIHTCRFFPQKDMVIALPNIMLSLVLAAVAASAVPLAEPIDVSSDFSIEPSDRVCYPYCGDDQEQNWDISEGLKLDLLKEDQEDRYLTKRSPLVPIPFPLVFPKKFPKKIPGLPFKKLKKLPFKKLKKLPFKALKKLPFKKIKKDSFKALKKLPLKKLPFVVKKLPLVKKFTVKKFPVAKKAPAALLGGGAGLAAGGTGGLAAGTLLGGGGFPGIPGLPSLPGLPIPVPLPLPIPNFGQQNNNGK